MGNVALIKTINHLLLRGALATAGWVSRVLIFCVPIPLLIAQPSLESTFKQVNFSEREIYSYVRSITQDRQGFLWIGTNFGLFRFDGYRSVRFKSDSHDPNSLRDNVVEVTYLDQHGNLWLGTESGLDHLDLQSGAIDHFTLPSVSFSSQWVTAIGEDLQGNLWVGTKNGLNVLDRASGTFLQFLPERANPDAISDHQIRALHFDRAGNLWIGTNNNGLNRLLADEVARLSRTKNPRDFRFDHFIHEPADSAWVTSQGVLAIFEDRQSRLWVGYGGDLFSFDRDREQLERVPLEWAQPTSRAGIWALSEDSRQNLWIGTHGRGLFRIPPHGGEERLPFVERFAPYPKFFTRIGYEVEAHPSYHIWTIYEDRFKNLWFGGLMGLARWAANDSNIRHYVDPAHPEMVCQELALAEDRSGRVLFTDKTTHEVCVLNVETGQLDRYKIDPENQPEESRIYYSELFVDRSGRFWLGTNDRGVYSLDPESGRIQHLHSELIDPFSTSNSLGLVPSICEDSYGNFWIATWRDGLKRYNAATGAIEHFLPDPDDPHSIGSARVNVVMQDSRGEVWMGTQHGLSRYRREAGGFEHFLRNESLPNTISHNRVNAIFEDSRGNFWVGTEGGLNWMDRKNGRFLAFTESDGLENPFVESILEDDRGRIWLSTKAKGGLTSFDPQMLHLSGNATGIQDPFRQQSGLFRNLSTTDGLKSQEYSKGIRSSKTGELFFIGDSGIDYFHPDSLVQDTLKPQVVFTSLQRSGSGLGTPQIDHFISAKESITLTYRDTIITFEVAALTFKEPENNRYKYQLEGFSDQWYELGHKREITFTNLSPGNYTLRVMGSNEDGVWNPKPTVLNLEILPPWWRNNWAYLLYAIVIMTSVRWVWLSERRRHRMQSEARRLKELDRYKTRFYTNITHEFRTPLTIILGMVNQIRDNPERWYGEGLQMIQRNGRQLLQLVNQILDLNKLDKGKIVLKPRRGNLSGFLEYLLQSFLPLAEAKKIRLHHVKEIDLPDLVFDPEQLSKIITNLLSNAIKFTPEGGEIYVQLRQHQSDRFEFVISDSGRGIPEEELPLIFDRFYQVREDGPDGADNLAEGTGIGLSLTRELVELMGGTIAVKSRPGQGTKFTVSLPLRSEGTGVEAVPLLQSGEHPEWEDPPEVSHRKIPELMTSGAAGLKERVRFSRELDPVGPVILLIEDNRDVLQYLASCLEYDFQLEFARNGREGLRLALELVPAMIISDIMMPEMNGYEVCRALKNDIRTSHIPVILLTAKADQEARLEGLEAGADAYLTKPFNRDELDTRIRKLMELRRQLRVHYSQAGIGLSVSGSGENLEDRFLLEIHTILAANLSDDNFGITQLCEQLRLSRSQVHNKLKALTGKSTSIYIRNFRLEKSKLLLTGTDLNISEIAYAVGFRTPVYFTQTFTDTVGIPPTQYRTENKQAGDLPDQH